MTKCLVQPGYRPRHFRLEELVDPGTFAALGQRAWQLLDPVMLWTMDQLRDLHGPMVCNDWHRGGSFRFRGYRPPLEKTGATYSLHRCGKAFDVHFTQAQVAAVRADILARPELPAYSAITALEVDVAWLHCDFRNHDKAGQGVLLVRP